MIEDISTIVIAVSAFVTTGATITLAIITWRYVKATERYTKATEEMLKNSNIPEIQVSLTNKIQSYNISTIDFCVQNIGTGFAYDIKFSGDFTSLQPQTSNEPLSEYPIIKNGISHLAPVKRYQIPIIWQPLKLSLPERTYDVGVTYRDSADTEHKKHFCLDFTKYEGYTQIGDPSIESIANSLLRIDETLREMKKQRDSQNQ